MRKCPKCGLFYDPELWSAQDELGQGRFCNSLWGVGRGDKGELFCSTRAAEGHSVATCPYTEKNVKKNCCRLVCTHSADPDSLKGTCQDFEPSMRIRQKFRLDSRINPKATLRSVGFFSHPGVGARLEQVFRRHKILTVGDLLNRSWVDICSMKYVGDASLKWASSQIKSLGLELKKQTLNLRSLEEEKASYMIVYDDHDRDPEFYECTEEFITELFEKQTVNWNCHLFKKVRSG